MEGICNYALETNHIPMVYSIMFQLRALCGYNTTIYGSACNAISHDKCSVLLRYFIIIIIIIITVPPF